MKREKCRMKGRLGRIAGMRIAGRKCERRGEELTK